MNIDFIKFQFNLPIIDAYMHIFFSTTVPHDHDLLIYYKIYMI